MFRALIGFNDWLSGCLAHIILEGMVLESFYEMTIVLDAI
jgi:hypothetical protein